MGPTAQDFRTAFGLARLPAADRHHRRRRRRRRGQGARSAHARLDDENAALRAALEDRTPGVAGRDRGTAQRSRHRIGGIRLGPARTRSEPPGGGPMSKSIAAAGPRCCPAGVRSHGVGPDGTITGVVTDASTAQPLAGVSVRWCTGNSTAPVCAAATTNAQGGYSLVVPAGTH